MVEERRANQSGCSDMGSYIKTYYQSVNEDIWADIDLVLNDTEENNPEDAGCP